MFDRITSVEQLEEAEGEMKASDQRLDEIRLHRSYANLSNAKNLVPRRSLLALEWRPPT